MNTVGLSHMKGLIQIYFCLIECIFFLIIDHPEGTGKDIPPFASLWFCGIGADRVKRGLELYDNKQKGTARVATSIKQLIDMGAIRDEKPRPNPRQRRKRQQSASTILQPSSNLEQLETQPPSNNPHEKPKRQKQSQGDTNQTNSQRKQSKYRNEKGKRIKKRF